MKKRKRGHELCVDQGKRWKTPPSTHRRGEGTNGPTRRSITSQRERDTRAPQATKQNKGSKKGKPSFCFVLFRFLLCSFLRFRVFSRAVWIGFGDVVLVLLPKSCCCCWVCVSYLGRLAPLPRAGAVLPFACCAQRREVFFKLD